MSTLKLHFWYLNPEYEIYSLKIHLRMRSLYYMLFKSLKTRKRIYFTSQSTPRYSGKKKLKPKPIGQEKGSVFLQKTAGFWKNKLCTKINSYVNLIIYAIQFHSNGVGLTYKDFLTSTLNRWYSKTETFCVLIVHWNWIWFGSTKCCKMHFHLILSTLSLLLKGNTMYLTVTQS